MILIVPIAGKSTRFPGTRPKWMLTHPSGKFMVSEAIAGLNPASFEYIVFVYLQEHEDRYHFKKGLMEELEDLKLLNKVKMVALPAATRDQPETVYQAITIADIRGPICVKDSDNYFTVELKPDNFVCYFNLNEVGLINPTNKSYLSINSFGNITNIVEKQVISPYFCVGGYGFRDAQLFVDTLKTIESLPERYLSNVIFQCILNGERYQAVAVNNYLDWGTLEDWEKYKRSFATLFIDMDGVLAEHSSSHFPPYYGETGPLADNVEIVKKLQESGKFEIIITTARPEKYRDITVRQLESFGLRFDHLLMQLKHGKRILINDYSKSNPYKSCDAINLKRNSHDLKDILRDAIGIDYHEI